MNRIKNELYKKRTYKKRTYKKWTYKLWIIKNERIKNERIKNELIKKELIQLGTVDNGNTKNSVINSFFDDYSNLKIFMSGLNVSHTKQGQPAYNSFWSYPTFCMRGANLKGQYNEIFDPQFFHHSNRPVQLTNGLK